MKTLETVSERKERKQLVQVHRGAVAQPLLWGGFSGFSALF